MEKRIFSRSMRLWVVVSAMLILAAAPTTWAGATDTTTHSAGHASASTLADLAQAGQFGDVLAQLKQTYAGHAIDAQPAVQRLMNELEAYKTNQSKRTQTQQQAYAKEMKKVQASLARGAAEQSLIDAIDAKALAFNKKKLLAEPTVKQVTAHATTVAQQAAKSGNWVRALSLYRLLDDLHKVAATYHQQVLTASHHVEILQVFAPKQLAKLYDAQQKALVAQMTDPKTKRDVKPVSLDEQRWQSRIKGANELIFKQTLKRSATGHVTGIGYEPLMESAVHELAMLVRTPQLRTVFAGLSDRSNRATFASYLDRLSAQLKQDPGLDYDQSMSMLSKIEALNRKTVALPSEVIAYQMTEGVTDKLDRFSRVIWPEEVQQFSRETSGTFCGVGIQISNHNGEIRINTPLAGTPAVKAGIMPGDVIAAVNGQNAIGWTLDHAIRKITGPEGTFVTLGIKRTGHDKLIPFRLKRKRIAIHSILGWQLKKNGKWNYWIDRKDRIGYVRLTQFIPQTAHDLDKAVAQMQSTGPIHGLILDLRYNPGGLLTSAAAVADRFISHGPLVYTVTENRHKNAVLWAHQSTTYRRFPLVVLVNGGTASAAEILTGALQDYARAEIVGTRTYGKGSVQNVMQIDDGQAIFKLTEQYYMLPLGRIIHRFPGSKKWGIDPDIKVPMTPEQMAAAMKLRQRADVLPVNETLVQQDAIPRAQEILKKGVDPQLATALLVLKTKMVARWIALANTHQKTQTQ